jgi:TPR repeat protein
MIGVRYSKGQGVEQDYEQAVFWYRKAAEQDEVNAQNNLGCMYRDGRGVVQDDDNAILWFRKAAKQGHLKAQENLTKLNINWMDT